jgi:superfamily II DNA or RNA helicase
MTVELAYLGRALRLSPAVYGELFHDTCTVIRMENVVEWKTERDAMTGEERTYPVRTRKPVPVPLFWYADGKDDSKFFCTYAGYGPRLEAMLRRQGLEVEVRDLVSDGLPAPDLTKIADVVWRPKQAAVFARLLAHKRGRIVCPTAFGKTYIAKQLAKVYPKSEIILTVPYQDVAKDIYKDLVMQLGPQTVGLVGAGKMNPKRLTVAVSHSLHHCPKDASIILADECHALMTDHFIKLLNRFYRARLFGFTATPKGRSDRADALGEAVFGPVLVDISYQEGVDAGNIVPIKVRMFRSEVGPDVAAVADKNKAKADRLGLWLNMARNGLIAKSVRAVEKELGPDAQILVVVDKTEHAYAMGQLLPDYAVVSGEPTPDRVKQMLKRGAMLPTQAICTQAMRDHYRTEFEANRLKRVICTKVWRQGVDFRDLACLVRADGTASPIDSGQVPGRLSRLGRETEKSHGLLLDFYDTFSSNLESRSKQRVTVYRKNKWSIENR